jgi:dihydroorotase
MGSMIRNGRIVDPANSVDTRADLYIANGRIASIGKEPDGFQIDETIDASGLLIAPGLVDLRARLREPGQKHKGTIRSETRAAAAGGITTLCTPPDTIPVIDNPSVADLIQRLAAEAGMARILPSGALTRELKGEQLSEMQALKESGCVVMSNASRPISNALVQRRALEYAATLGLTVMINAEDPGLAGDGCVHEGPISTRLGLAAIPECAEVVAVSRDLLLIEQTGVRAHFSQLSSARAIELVANARERGLPVSADVAIHHLYLTEMDVADFNSLCHLRPPLRGQRDRDAIRMAVADGVFSALCSDHQPHDIDAKLAPFAATEAGASGLETLLPLTLRLVDEQLLSLPEALAYLTHKPAAVLEIEAGTLSPGALADICIIDPEQHWRVSAETLLSHGKNSPFLGWEMKGKVRYTLLEGRVVFKAD